MRQAAFVPGAVNYDSEISSKYPPARAFSPETAETWCALLRSLLIPANRLTILDLGCGTGRFSALFAERFNLYVIGLDPAFRMLKAAARDVSRPNLAYSVARAEALPLRDCSCDLAWLSHVVHHIADRASCAKELRRVLRPSGRIVIRGTFGDRLDGFPTLFQFFPGAREIAAQFPTLDQVSHAFTSAGFIVETLRRIPQTTCASLREFAARTRLRADSTLVLLPDSEFQQCQAALERAAETETGSSAVIETLDVLVLKAPSQLAA